MFDGLQDQTLLAKKKGHMDMTAYAWAHKTHHIVHERYWGKNLNGPNANKLLSKIDDLIDFLPDDLKCFGIALSLFDEVKKSMFGSVELHKNWMDKLQRFENVYYKLDREFKIGFTPKTHVCIKINLICFNILKALIIL